MTVDALTRDLVSIPSHEDETAAGDFVENWIRGETDADVRRDDVGNVIATRGHDAVADGAGWEVHGADLALVGHHDVVPPDPDQVVADGEYVVEQRDGRLYGRGTADMKGALAAAMLAFRDAEPAGTLAFASFVGEEVGGVGARHAIDEGFTPSHAVVLEGSTNYSGPDVTDVAVAHKGRRGHTITARGSAAHASETEAGENAIYRACAAIGVLREIEPPSVTVAGETLTGSLVATEITGGTAMNVVPDECVVTVDERTAPGERAPIDRVEAIEGVELRIDQELPPMRCTDDAFADAVLAVANETQRSEATHVTKPHATDAGWLSGAGTECVICGPAEPGEAHTADESVSIAVLERCHRIYRAIAESWPSR